jgi:hypothetical protein
MVGNTTDWTREFARPQVRDTLAKVIDESTPGLIDRLGSDPNAYADLLAVTHLVSEEADELLRETVISARHSGMNWEQIGEVLGISRQAAQQKFSAASTADVADVANPAFPISLTPNATAPAMLNYADLPPVGTQVMIDIDYTGGSEEVKMLNRAGQYGWHGVAFTAETWTLEFDNRQWQHLSSFAKEPFGGGWQRIGRFLWSVWWARPTNLPILPGNPDPHSFKSQRKLEKELRRKAGIAEPTLVETLVGSRFLTIEREQ